MPAYQCSVGGDGDIHVFDWTESLSRAATPDEKARLPSITTFSEVCFTSALAAHHGLSPWREGDEELRPPDPGLTSREMFPGQAGQYLDDDDCDCDAEQLELRYRLTGTDYGTQAERDLVHDLEDQLEGVLDDLEVGDVGGDEFGGGEAVLFLHGPSCEQLWEAVQPYARALALRPASALLRRADETERRVEL